ncbi:3' terminal RNA ribose 2'-O-methyltransferase Hen1 [Actinoalloteichus hymeniacidonis]|uniref:Small RNA 2'-O-methyltransferase n=1 Tax=Actinoalloteichus hymeniacidonis TaxID=340345 RepID=A0AAC9HLZ1_9PSEU|nr:3' terminal RNA ribose 2'-O-methyltransferase Hen1 [Actinoalloteichus hymeniacidonis]AOS61643.1 3' terminal RNA ribose 2'-O-methyltransferase Hen1 [Actinoalloteichus hymeniacidonis]MBB5910344.1 3' terminal RNA ribose 2'-O-methyltransferase Hen1 [Actinoalloteichus hymeniacidonis]
MLVTVTTTHRPATDLGFLLHKHPDRVQSFPAPAGTAHVFYPQAQESVCTAALLLEIDPIALARRAARGDRRDLGLGSYVNDRPYAASSMVAVALGSVFATAMRGRCDARPELADTAIPLVIEVPAVPTRGDAGLIHRLFEPLGWQVDTVVEPLDAEFPGWGDSPYARLRLTGTLRLADALNQLYVLLPVLDAGKHYWVAEQEVDKLLRAGAGWLAAHPERDLITARYLAHRGDYVASALGRLAAEVPEENVAPDTVAEQRPARGTAARERRAAVVEALRASGASSVVDLGCGNGELVADLLADPTFTEVTGVDVSMRSLRIAEKRIGVERLSDSQRSRLTLRQSALTYLDDELLGYDAAALVEVVEHVDPARLPALERAVFGHARPGTVVVTTPNREHNASFETLTPAGFRHTDHRFEWTRGEFAAWARQICRRYRYRVRFEGVGATHPEFGPLTQLAVFNRQESEVDPAAPRAAGQDTAVDHASASEGAGA